MRSMSEMVWYTVEMYIWSLSLSLFSDSLTRNLAISLLRKFSSYSLLQNSFSFEKSIVRIMWHALR